ncbi:MAG: hypothetical protein HOI35_06690 [Woeseia sp.]|nr:hypothetical protein [Woeseia sp.]
MILHLMIAGRLHWRKDKVRVGGKQQLAAFDVSSGSLLLTEEGMDQSTHLSWYWQRLFR